MDSVFDQSHKFVDLWVEFARKMVPALGALDPSSTPPEAARQFRSVLFDAMSRSSDEFLRSEQFLQMMKQSMDASIGFRRELNEFLTNAWHSGQGVAKQDVDTLMLAVRHLEQRVLDRMEDLTGRLEQLGGRIDAVERAIRGGNGSSPPVSPAPPPASPAPPAPTQPRRAKDKSREPKEPVQE